MTLWFESLTAERYVKTYGEPADIREERDSGGKPQVIIEIPEGQHFNVDVEEFLYEFSGCNPEVEFDVPSATVECFDVNGETIMGVVPEGRRATIIFSASEKATSGYEREFGER